LETTILQRNSGQSNKNNHQGEISTKKITNKQQRRQKNTSLSKRLIDSILFI
jgi:hypothetical protein